MDMWVTLRLVGNYASATILSLKSQSQFILKYTFAHFYWFFTFFWIKRSVSQSAKEDCQSCNWSSPVRWIKLDRPVLTGLERLFDQGDRTGLVFFRPITTLTHPRSESWFILATEQMVLITPNKLRTILTQRKKSVRVKNCFMSQLS